MAADAGLNEFWEIVDGGFVVKRVGGNPHHCVARRLAQAFEEQWAGVVAGAPGNWATGQLGNWALDSTADGRVVLGRIPDVLVDGDRILTDDMFTGVPDAAAEVWSPGNTLAELNAKRSEYRRAGLPVLREAFLTDAGGGHRWTTVSAAAGEMPLTVGTPRPFTVAPNDLLRRPA